VVNAAFVDQLHVTPKFFKYQGCRSENRCSYIVVIINQSGYTEHPADRLCPVLALLYLPGLP
jgi:hypothetical protein